MKAVIAVISDLSTDMRVRKQALLLAGEGFSVTVIGRSSGSHLTPDMPGVKIYKLKVPCRKGPAMYLFFNFFLLIRLLFMRYDICVSCDLDTLIPCFLVSRMTGTKLVYDSHEYFTGQQGLAERKIKYALWKKAERMIVPKINHMITVSQSIADIYRNEYGVNPLVIRNVASSVARLVPHDRYELGAGDDELLIVLQGSGINAGRGATELIEAVKRLERVRLLIIGSGDIIESLHLRERKPGAETNMIFLPRMTWEEMMRYTMCCDAGLSLDTDTCINQRYSLPNKLFDYIAAGIPAVVSPLPEVSAIIEMYGCGLVLDEVTPDAIAGQLERLRDDRSLLRELKKKALEAGRELNWEKEMVKEQEFFRSVTHAKSE
ncbi:MAG: glycosyltransferase [Bacteroidales bacterium]|nr:glycosyltransferase [Bacteroidales bacterium]